MSSGRTGSQEISPPVEEAKEVVICIDHHDLSSSQDSSTSLKGDKHCSSESPLSPNSYSQAQEEVSRVLAVQSNFYAVLQVTKQSTPSETRSNYLKLSRLVHPDKCHDPRAHHASATVNRAYETLKNPVKKALYDRFVTDYPTRSTKGVSYDEWEATEGRQAVALPAWMHRVLGCPGGSACLVTVLVGLLPLVLVAGLLLGVACLVFLPIRVAFQLWHRYSQRRAGSAAARGFVGVRVPQTPPLPHYPKPSSPHLEQELHNLAQRGGVVSCSDTRSAIMSPRNKAPSGATSPQEGAEAV